MCWSDIAWWLRKSNTFLRPPQDLEAQYSVALVRELEILIRLANRHGLHVQERIKQFCEVDNQLVLEFHTPAAARGVRALMTSSGQTGCRSMAVDRQF